MNCVEQVGGIEPADSGVAHRCVAATLHLLGDLATNEIWFLNQRGRPKARPMIRAWVGWESNPRCDGLRIRCKACVCYQPRGPSWSHPLESNQNLSGFSRARRPTTQEWDVTLRAPAGRRSVLSWVPCQAPSSSSLFSCQRSQVARAAVRSAHLGPCGTRAHGEYTCRVRRSGLRSPDHESQRSVVE